MDLREMLECRRGISTKSLLQYAPRGSADRCLAIRFSSKTVNVVFETSEEMGVWAAALGALGAHVTSLIGMDKRPIRFTPLPTCEAARIDSPAPPIFIPHRQLPRPYTPSRVGTFFNLSSRVYTNVIGQTSEYTNVIGR